MSERITVPSPMISLPFSPRSPAGVLRGVFRSRVDLQGAINRYLGEHNRKPKPFVWTADPDHIIEKVNHGYQAIASNQLGGRLKCHPCARLK